MKINKQQIAEAVESALLEYFDKNDKYNRVSLVDDPKVRSGKDWANNMGNFPVKRNGKIFYVSRSVAMSLYCYCQNGNGEWCVLANQRGPGAPTGRGLWNVVCGYLDYGESAEDGIAREAFEECGVKIPANKLKMQGVNSRNLHGPQNVTMRFAAVLDGTTEQYPLSMANCEPGEVLDVKWIPLSEVQNYKWAFGGEHKVIEQAKTSLNYENGVISNDINAKINSLKNELRGNPYASQLLDSILSELKNGTN